MMATKREEQEPLLGEKGSGEYGTVDMEDDGIQLQLTPPRVTWAERTFPAGFKYELKELLSLTWPLLLTQLCMALLPVTSLVFCGQLDATALGAVSLANSVINVTCLAVGMGLATACDTLFAQSYGSANKKQVGEYLQKAILILLLACFPTWAIHLNTESLLRLIGQDEEIARLAGNYLLYYFPAVLLSFLYQVLNKYIQNQNIVLPCVMIGIAGNMVNALLHWLLVYHFDWRTDGSAVAQVGANFTFLVLTLLYIWGSKCYEETWDGWSMDALRHWDLFLKLALPGMAMLCLEWWCFEVGTLLAGTLSKIDLGVQSVIFYMEGICFQIPTGLSIATSIRVGQYLGAGDADGAMTSSRVSYFIVSFWAAIAVVLFTTLRYQVPKVFSQDPDVIEQSAEVFPILAAYCVFESASAVSSGVLRGCGRQMVGAVVVFIGYWVISLPIGIPLMLLTPLTVQGLWIGYATGIFVESIIYLVLIATTNWQLESEQAQIRTGTQEEEEEEEKGKIHAVTEEDEEQTTSRSDEENGGKPTPSAVTRRTSRAEPGTAHAPVVYETSGPRRIGGAVRQSQYARQSSRGGAGGGAGGGRTSGTDHASPAGARMNRSYSSSALISTLHAKRFSSPADPDKRYVIPARKMSRRFSAQYTPQIQEDHLLKAANAERTPTARLVCLRLLALLISAAVLAAGVVVRLYVVVPYHAKQICIPLPELGGTNVTYPPPPENTTLPWCNATQLAEGGLLTYY